MMMIMMIVKQNCKTDQQTLYMQQISKQKKARYKQYSTSPTLMASACTNSISLHMVCNNFYLLTYLYMESMLQAHDGGRVG